MSSFATVIILGNFSEHWIKIFDSGSQGALKLLDTGVLSVIWPSMYLKQIWALLQVVLRDQEHLVDCCESLIGVLVAVNLTHDLLTALINAITLLNLIA